MKNSSKFSEQHQRYRLFQYSFRCTACNLVTKLTLSQVLYYDFFKKIFFTIIPVDCFCRCKLPIKIPANYHNTCCKNQDSIFLGFASFLEFSFALDCVKQILNNYQYTIFLSFYSLQKFKRLFQWDRMPLGETFVVFDQSNLFPQWYQFSIHKVEVFLSSFQLKTNFSHLEM